MYCPECGAEVPDGAKFCTACGHPVGGPAGDGGRTPPDYQSKVYVNKKSEGIALILSLILPGLGELYVGRIKRGVVILLAYVLCSALTAAIALALFYDDDELTLYPFTAVLNVVIWIYAMYDSYASAKQYNEYLLNHEGDPPPKE